MNRFNVALGLDMVEPEIKDVVRALGASKMETFQKCVSSNFDVPLSFAGLLILGIMVCLL